MPGKAYSPGIVVLQHVYIGTLRGQGVAACIVPSTIHWGGMGFVLLGKVILPQGALGEHTHARDNLCFLDRQTLPGTYCCTIMEWRTWSFSGDGNFPVSGM